MREKFGEFYREHIRNKVTRVKTALGHTTADNIADQLRDSKPVDFDALLGESNKDIKPSKIDKHGEIIEGDKKS